MFRETDSRLHNLAACSFLSLSLSSLLVLRQRYTLSKLYRTGTAFVTATLTSSSPEYFMKGFLSRSGSIKTVLGFSWREIHLSAV